MINSNKATSVLHMLSISCCAYSTAELNTVVFFGSVGDCASATCSLRFVPQPSLSEVKRFQAVRLLPEYFSLSAERIIYRQVLKTKQ